MVRPHKAPLRPLTDDERTTLDQVARSGAERADRVAHAKALLAVAAGATFSAAARAAGRRSGDAVATLVGRFNRAGVAALTRRPGGAPPIHYGPDEVACIRREARRLPDRALDGTATWSLTTRQRALRQAPDGLPGVSTFTILRVLHDAGFGWQRDRTWCATGVVQRKRKAGGGGSARSGRRRTKGVIDRAYRTAEGLGIPLWCADEAGADQAIPHPGASRQPQGMPAHRPHEDVRGGTAKLLTVFRPATGAVRAQPVTHTPTPCSIPGSSRR